MDVKSLPIPGAKLIRPARHGDARGFFSELFNKARYAEHGVSFAPVQENLAFSARPGVVRGLHAQRPPFAQAKLVRPARGRMYDVVVDARKGSPAFGQWAGVELAAATGDQLFVPAGCLHGYATLEPDCEVIYLVDAPYDPDGEIRVRWDDPALGVTWRLDGRAPIVSPADAAAQDWAAFDSPFRFA